MGTRFVAFRQDQCGQSGVGKRMTPSKRTKPAQGCVMHASVCHVVVARTSACCTTATAKVDSGSELRACAETQELGVCARGFHRRLTAHKA